MLRHRSYGPVDYFAMARSWGGRHILTTGVYVVDGLLIDTGPPNAHVEIQQVLEQAEINACIITHHHEDHVGNAALVGEAIGRAPLAHPRTLELTRAAPRLPLYRRIAWGTPRGCELEPIGDEVRTPNHCFRVIHTPGHAEDHITLHEPDRGWVFTGDLFLGIRRNVAFAYEDFSAWFDSLRTLMSIPDGQLFCAHLGGYPSHQRNLGHKLDFLLGLRHRAVVCHEEGRSVREIRRELGLPDTWIRWWSRGELCGSNLVRALLRDAGKIA